MASGGPGSPGLEYKDYYAVLGVPRAASQAEVKKAFRKLARQHHPDAKPGDTAAERKFKEINEANEVLSDPAKRRQYDQLGANWDAISQARAAGTSGAGPFGGFGGGNVRYEFRTADAGEFSDFFRVFFGEDVAANGTRATTGRGSPAPGGAMGFDDILAGMGIDGRRGRWSRRDRPRPRLDRGFGPAQARAETHGPRGDRRDHPRRGLPGHDPPGRGRRQAARDHDPEGCRERDPHQADRARTGRRRPDRRGPHAARRPFTRRGADLERDLPLTLEEALLGAEVPIETLKGRVLLTIPAGTQPGRTFRLSGQGMPRFKGDGFGDLYVKSRLILPTDLSDEARSAAKTFLFLADQPDPRSD